MRTSSVELIILEFLNHEQRHLTSQQVYLQIRERLPAVNPSTVYRALERLVKGGKVSVSDMGFGSAVFELVHTEISSPSGLPGVRTGGCFEPPGSKAVFLMICSRPKIFMSVTNHLILFGYVPTARIRRMVRIHNELASA